MPEDYMRYDVLTREALRGVVRQSLERVIETGLPGKHHFYISFATRYPGVDIDPDLLATHPEEMTIVLELQFWDLAVDDEAFEVTLKFNRVPKYLRVPFKAITVFHDPSVNFALRFDRLEGDPETSPQDADSRDARARAREDDADTPVGQAPDTGGAVVSLDAFRKKSD